MSQPFVLNLIPAIEDIAPQNPKGAGRKPVSTVNPIAHIAGELLFDNPAWLSSIIFGSCLTAAGQSQNVCNVSMRDVRGTLLLKEFTVQAVMTTGIAKRQAERVIKAVRHAAHGIHGYLLRRPKLLRRYEDNYDCRLESKLAYSHVALVPYKPLREVPEHIDAMRLAGDYLAYGEALRAFRKEC
ncbi:hypothetical protein [Pseudomonas sp. B21-010]|uniref:hypothetical protein n=1 Tax=Pseudomonas sp. B21-010 TaxID=2895471 RepID=UPI002160D174|nr:hypothetical protein [Pseudomonas sp. B21-010]UVM63082.1 hypothetical protein LOY50_08595 [Pseudomonas sp. B21-010]